MGEILREAHNTELKKLTKKYKILKKINIFLLYGVVLLIILISLENLGIIELPFYEQNLPFSHRIFINTWVGFPYIFIEKKTDDTTHHIIGGR